MTITVVNDRRARKDTKSGTQPGAPPQTQAVLFPQSGGRGRCDITVLR
jgi:hypothetical protein